MSLLHFLSDLSLITTAHAASTQFSVLDMSFKDGFILFFKIVWVWIALPFTLFLWCKAGFLYVISEGNSESLKKAHDTMRTSIIWTVILIVIQGFLFTLTQTFTGLL